jgi:hypothetical protein
MPRVLSHRLAALALLLILGALLAVPAAHADPVTESEPNDGAATSQVMLDGQEWHGAMQTDNDMDVWKLHVGSGTHQVRFTLTRSVPADGHNPWSVLFAVTDRLYENTSQLWIYGLAKQYVDEGKTENMAYTLTGPRTFYLQASLYGHLQGPTDYTVAVQGPGLLARPSCARQRQALARARSERLRAKRRYAQRATAGNRRRLHNASAHLRQASSALKRCQALAA